MPNTTAWDKVPVHAWYYKAPGVPDTGTVQFRIIGAPNGVKRTDGRAIYRAGATFTVTVGDPAQQDSALLATLKAAYKARDAAILGAAFNGTTWDAQWAAALPAMICTGFYAQNDPDITPQGWQVEVTERLGGGTTGPYPIPLTVAMIDLTPVPGLNLATIELPAGTPFTPAPTYAKGQPGGVAALDSDGDVVDATGAKVIASGGGAVSSVAGKTGSVTLTKSDVGLGSVDNTSDTAKPISTATQAALNAKAPTASPTFTGTVTGITKAMVGLGNVDNTSDLAKPISTATQAALDTKGTSNLVIGTTSTTAKAGNWTPAVSDIPTLTLAQLPPGGTFRITWNGTAWRYNGANITSRPTARTDLTMLVIGGTTFPTFALADDLQLRDPA